MKAKEAIKLYEEASDKTKALSIIAEDYLSSFSRLVKARHIKTMSAINSLIEEMDLKWRKFAERFEEIRSDGFLLLLDKKVPGVVNAAGAASIVRDLWHKGRK